MSKFFEIDWEVQWASHGLNYHDGFVHVDLSEYSRAPPQKRSPVQLRLKPGPGFGDLSHPTTRLVLKLMQPHVMNKHVLDVGCGSGILTLAALALGAKSVTAIDIDEQALEHAQENCLLNGMNQAVKFLIPEQYHGRDEKEIVVLKNMIQSEQVQAWNSLSHIHSRVSKAITSGVLAEGRDSYLHLCLNRGWELLEEVEEDNWLGFIFVDKVALQDEK